MLLIHKISDKASNLGEGLIGVVFISTHEFTVIWIELQLNDDLINILKIHFSCSDFVQNIIGADFSWLKSKLCFPQTHKISWE